MQTLLSIFRIDLRRTDPLFQVCQELTDEVVKEMALMTVQSTIKSLVNSHMAFSKSFDWLDDLIIETIQPMIYNVVSNNRGVKWSQQKVRVSQNFGQILLVSKSRVFTKSCLESRILKRKESGEKASRKNMP